MRKFSGKREFPQILRWFTRKSGETVRLREILKLGEKACVLSGDTLKRIFHPSFKSYVGKAPKKVFNERCKLSEKVLSTKTWNRKERVVEREN